jgi:uncharacterized membrane protein YhiD involved in acid resistance
MTGAFSHPLLALTAGEGWRQVGELGLAFVLSSLIGLEREIRQKAAGLRTHTLVGAGAALFLLVSKYGFGDVLVSGRVVLDPSRVAAGIVAGIGFIGGGLIFVRRDTVRGLTTAAIVWVTAAIGMACGAGLLVLAVVVTAGHFVVVLLYPWPSADCRGRGSPRPSCGSFTATTPVSSEARSQARPRRALRSPESTAARTPISRASTGSR